MRANRRLGASTRRVLSTCSISDHPAGDGETQSFYLFLLIVCAGTLRAVATWWSKRTEPSDYQRHSQQDKEGKQYVILPSLNKVQTPQADSRLGQARLQHAPGDGNCFWRSFGAKQWRKLKAHLRARYMLTRECYRGHEQRQLDAAWP